MEQRTEVKAIQVDFKCPKCNNGYLKHTGMVLSSNPPQYPHYCDAGCGYIETFMGVSYPYITYERIAQSNSDSIISDTPGMA